jgi:hypothetical protein
MKCFKTARDFARKVCREKGQSSPREQWYLVDNPPFGISITEKAPRSHGLKRIIFCVDRERFAEKMYGVWVENPSEQDKELLKQRRLCQAFDCLRGNPCNGNLSAPYDVEEDIKKELDSFLYWAKDRCSDQAFNTKVLEKTLASLQQSGKFSLLNMEPDPLKKAEK